MNFVLDKAFFWDFIEMVIKYKFEIILLMLCLYLFS